MTHRQGYRIRVGEREHEVEVEVDGAGQRRILVDGHPFEVAEAGGHALRVSPEAAPGVPRPQLEVTLAGEVRPSEAWLLGSRIHVEVQTEQEARLAAALGKSSGGPGSGSLTAPMPGRVVKILVSEGQSVTLGAPAIIVEAMKMENELQAPATGVVRQICVGEGDTVDSGQVLIEITVPDEAEPAKT